jgi:CubicO group peptidase (beta-lactamase class C family)
MSSTLFPLPAQPAGIAWPTARWPRAARANARDELKSHASAIFHVSREQGETLALLVVKSGQIVYERYAPHSNATHLQYSWSIAKSITHALVGILVRQGCIDIHAPAGVPEWQTPGDPRGSITIDHLLRMSSGLQFNEAYVDAATSDVIAMLGHPGRHDMGAFAANKPLLRPLDAAWSYSSGTTNIICRILRDLVGGPTEMLAFMRRELFEPIGMITPLPQFDTSGTFVGSSYCLAIPQDFARFGYLYLRDGVWGGRRILPEGWVDYARTSTYENAERGYGAHWWVKPGSAWFYANGSEGQRILVAPDHDVVIVRCGRTPADAEPRLWDHIDAMVLAA